MGNTSKALSEIVGDACIHSDLDEQIIIDMHKLQILENGKDISDERLQEALRDLRKLHKKDDFLPYDTLYVEGGRA